MIKAIDPNQLLTQMRALQTQATQTGDTKAININNSADKVDFGDAMKQAVNQVNELQQTSGQMKTDFELGKSDVNLVDVMIASQKATVAFEATIQVRNKLVEAYQEVMRMSL